MKTLVFFSICIFSSANLFSQILAPIRWSYGAKKLNSIEAVVFIKATVDDGWHIYSINQMVRGPVKTSFTFEPSESYTLTGQISEPEPKSRFEKSFGINVLYFEKSVVFQQKIKLKTRTTLIKGKANFMVCNDQKCLPPEDVEFSIPIN
jgi:hypothetical protein